MAQTRQPDAGRVGSPQPRRLRFPGSNVDLMAACALAALAALAFGLLPGGSAVRVALALSVLFLVPGYLLVEAVAGPAATNRSRAVRACVAVGVSPAIVGLLALFTALLPGGFRPASIVATITSACFALAGVALWRRLRAGSPASPEAVAAA